MSNYTTKEITLKLRGLLAWYNNVNPRMLIAYCRNERKQWPAGKKLRQLILGTTTRLNRSDTRNYSL